MRLCLSVFLTILRSCAAAATTQVELGNRLLHSLTEEDFVRYDDATISDLLHGKKNVGAAVVDAAKNCDAALFSERFDSEVAPLLDPNKYNVACAALFLVVERDASIQEATTVDLVDRLSKSDLKRCRGAVPNGFLPGVFLYVLTNTANKDTRCYSDKIDAVFLNEARECARDAAVFEAERVKSNVVHLWSRGENSIWLAPGDIFQLCMELEGNAICVIPVDTSFAVRLAKGIEGGDPALVSKRTLHGKWLEREIDAGETEGSIEARVKATLVSRGVFPDEEGRYPIGTVVPYERDGVTYLLLAIAEMDGNGNTQSDAGKLGEAIDSLVVFYDEECMGYPLHIPLIGTGRSRARLSYQESAALIFEGLMRNTSRLFGDITIVALPDVFSGLDIDAIGERDAE